MDNERLAARSEQFTDDNGCIIEKRCWILMSGDDDLQSAGYSLNASFNLFDDPKKTQVAEVKIVLDEVCVELFPQLIKSKLLIVPEYALLIAPRDLKILTASKIAYLERMAYLKHLKMHLFPKTFTAQELESINMANVRQHSRVTELATPEQVKKVAADYYA